MNASNPDRRNFLLGGVSVLGSLPFLARHASARSSRSVERARANELADPPRTLVLVELSGGNDGLNTVVPLEEKRYYDARPRIALRKQDLLPIADGRAFHPALVALRSIYASGAMAIVEGAGYERPNRSHFASQDIWYTARTGGRGSGDGWAGRLIADMYPEDRTNTHAIHVGSTAPYALHSTTHPVVYFETPAAYRWAQDAAAIAASAHVPAGDDPLERVRMVARSAEASSTLIRRAVAGYHPRTAYPTTPLGQDLQNAAAILQAGIGARLLSVTQTGYDTHDDELKRHAVLLQELDAALSAFYADLRGTPAGDRAMILVYSEFGRRVEDNASNGTDHGTAGPMFVLGAGVKGGLHGRHPSLETLDQGDLVYTTDFRGAYATIVKGWFGANTTSILGKEYAELPLLA